MGLWHPAIMKLQCTIHTVPVITVQLGNSLCGWQQEHATLAPYYALYLRHSLHPVSLCLIGVNESLSSQRSKRIVSIQHLLTIVVLWCHQIYS